MIKNLASKLRSHKEHEASGGGTVTSASAPPIPGNHPGRTAICGTASSLEQVPTRSDVYRHRRQIGVNLGKSCYMALLNPD